MSDEDGFVRDISAIDYHTRVTIQHPCNLEACKAIKGSTNARICVGKAGSSYRTESYLRYLSDHAAAMDSVWKEVDDTIFDPYGFVKVETCAKSKEAYIKRPDLGRIFSSATMDFLKKNCRHDIDVQILIVDGLSAYAIEENALDVYEVMLDGLKARGYSLGTPIYIRHGRVATMDSISEALHAKVIVQLIGERPGLITNQSMSCYMAYEASTKKPESQRTVISNIYAGGTPAIEAAAQIVDWCGVLMREKKSGAALKL